MNRHYLEAIADRESRGEPHYGYRTFHSGSRATGRYQMTPKALVDAEWFRSESGRLVPTERADAYGVRSLEDLLRNAPAQEEAMRDVSRRNEEQAAGYGLWNRLGLVYQGKNGRIAITPAGIAAAAHRQGALATRNYLNKLAANGWDSRNLSLKTEELGIETRLREFQAVPYVPLTRDGRERLRFDPWTDR